MACLLGFGILHSLYVHCYAKRHNEKMKGLCFMQHFKSYNIMNVKTTGCLKIFLPEKYIIEYLHTYHSPPTSIHHKKCNKFPSCAD